MKRKTVLKRSCYEIDEITFANKIENIFYNASCLVEVKYEVRKGKNRELVGAFDTYREALITIIEEEDHHYCPDEKEGEGESV